MEKFNAKNESPYNTVYNAHGEDCLIAYERYISFLLSTDNTDTDSYNNLREAFTGDMGEFKDLISYALAHAANEITTANKTPYTVELPNWKANTNYPPLSNDDLRIYVPVKVSYSEAYRWRV